MEAPVFLCLDRLYLSACANGGAGRRCAQRIERRRQQWVGVSLRGTVRRALEIRRQERRERAQLLAFQHVRLKACVLLDLLLGM